MDNLPTARPRRKLFASGRIAPKGTTAPTTHLAAHIDGAALRISSTMIPQVDAGGFLVQLEAAAMRHEMQRAIQEAA
jgi:hypothetical protein